MRFLLIIFVLFFSVDSLAQQKIVYDSSKIEQRNFSASSLSAYIKDKDFQYEKEAVQAETLWDRFWAWVWNKYDDIMSTDTGRTTMKIVYWILGIGAVAFFAFKVSGMNRLNLFTPSPQNTAPYTIEEENIHAIPFEEAIQNALQNGNYRLAIRLLYLENLKILADKNFIAWQMNKTNKDYLLELEKDFQGSFKHITDIFEYAWYGHLPVNKEDFDELKENVLKFQNKL